MKIVEFVVGNTIETSLVVKSASARKTKAGKTYLVVEFFDGQNTISGNYWDWTTNNIPPVNAILDITAQVTEWNGTKQLNIKTMSTCTTKILADFAPTSGYDIAETYKAAYNLMTEVRDDTLRTLALALMEQLREHWLHVPGAVSIHHNFIGGTLVHSYNVARLALSIANNLEGANVDLAVVGGMLHDLGKLFTYNVNGVNIEKTANGRLYEHLFMGAEFIGNFADNVVDTDDPYVYGKVRLLRHIILSHHGRLEYGSPVTPQCIEAYIVHYADTLDATNEQLRVATEAAPETTNWTDKLWALGNCPHLTHRYVAGILQEKTEE